MTDLTALEALAKAVTGETMLVTPAAVLDLIARVKRAEDEQRRAIDDLCKWRAAFQACTPGGSEFMTPESTREYMQMLKRETVQAKLALAAANKAALPAAPRAAEKE